MSGVKRSPLRYLRRAFLFYAYGVVVSDLPGRCSAGDTLNEAVANTPEAILTHFEALFDADQPLPKPKPLQQLRKDLEYKEWLWAVVDVDINALSGKAQRGNIALPQRVLSESCRGNDKAEHRSPSVVR